MYEAARSYLFLEALREGVANDEANDRAALAEKDVTRAIYHYADFHRSNVYGRPVFGSYVWPQIGEAYRRGMSPPLLPDPLWSVVKSWARKGSYKFPPILRAKLLIMGSTDYEVYYSKVLSSLAEQTGLGFEQLSSLMDNIDDEGSRNAFNRQDAPEKWAAILRDLYLREGAPFANDILS